MTPIARVLARHHDRCDELLAQADSHVARGDVRSARKATADFRDQIERHFCGEEDWLFPAFEQATGLRSGPTAVMRAEHARMRGLLDQMQAALDSGEVASCEGIATTLAILIGQHNQKEEAMLYPMCDAALAGAGADLAAQLGRDLEVSPEC